MSGKNFSEFRVFLELQRRNEISGSNTQVNRIPLFVTEIGISTNKTVMNMGVPFVGMVRGESLKLAFDVGMSEKTINMSGMLLGQTIIKDKGGDNLKEVTLTSFEMAQLLHSYTDASSLQDDQNIAKIVFLIPSRADENFEYHTGYDGNTDINQLPLIPFSWKNRLYDNDFAIGVGDGKQHFTPYTDNSKAVVGMTGFIRSFSTQITASDFPAISFSLDFEEAMVIGDNPFD